MHLTWQRPGGGGVRSGERERQCGKKAAARAALKGGELETAARTALKRGELERRQRGSVGWGVGGSSATLEGGEEAAVRLWRAGGGGSAAMEGG